MINISTIKTITNQNCFLLWSDVFIFGTIHCFGLGITVYSSIVLYPVGFPILWSPTDPGLTFKGDSVNVTVTLENIEDQLIMSQQSLTQLFKSTTNKWKLQGPDGDHETTNEQKW